MTGHLFFLFSNIIIKQTCSQITQVWHPFRTSFILFIKISSDLKYDNLKVVLLDERDEEKQCLSDHFNRLVFPLFWSISLEKILTRSLMLQQVIKDWQKLLYGRTSFRNRWRNVKVYSRLEKRLICRYFTGKESPYVFYLFDFFTTFRRSFLISPQPWQS